jgi:hypothetical protein
MSFLLKTFCLLSFGVSLNAGVAVWFVNKTTVDKMTLDEMIIDEMIVYIYIYIYIVYDVVGWSS